jgi:hypothetical protein
LLAFAYTPPPIRAPDPVNLSDPKREIFKMKDNDVYRERYFSLFLLFIRKIISGHGKNDLK